MKSYVKLGYYNTQRHIIGRNSITRKWKKITS